MLGVCSTPGPPTLASEIGGIYAGVAVRRLGSPPLRARKATYQVTAPGLHRGSPHERAKKR